VIAREDDTTFGILQSRFHEVWALAAGSWHGVGNDPRYTVGTCFGTFPFPEGMSPDCLPATYIANPAANAIALAAQNLVAARNRWLHPEELTETVAEVTTGFPRRAIPKNAAAASALRKRTLTNLYNMRRTPEGAWLDGLHTALDEAVAKAYGWPNTITDQRALQLLLDLNRSRSEKNV